MKNFVNVPHGKRILIVDDDPDILELLEFNLESSGYQVRTASDGMRALWKISDDPPPDCILLDLMMPSPDGYELCSYLKQSAEYRSIPVIIISALGLPNDVERGLKLGADAYLKKSSFNLEDLKATIAGLLAPA